MPKAPLPAQIVQAGVVMLRSVKDYEDEGKLSTAERALIAAVGDGVFLKFPNRCPETPSDENHIRGDLLALLFNGVSQNGHAVRYNVEVYGAYISGNLEFEAQRARGDIVLNYCRFEKQPKFRNSHFQTLQLIGSEMPGLFAQGVKVEHSLSLAAMKSTKMVTISGAKIGGQLNCHAASFAAITVKSDDTAMAFNAQNACVATQFLWTNVSVSSGYVMLASAHVGDLWDDEESWPAKLILDGFTYDRIYQPATTLAQKRLPWLKKGSVYKGTFTPQPYTHLAKVLREMGHDREARFVLMEREKLLAKFLYDGQRKEYLAALAGDQTQRGDAGQIWISMMGARAWASLMRRVTGYGYAPQRALIWALGCVGLATVIYFIGYRMGLMVPNSAIILTSADWATAFAANKAAPALIWQEEAGAAAKHFETFYPIPYALDVFLPVVDLGQHSAWTQTTATIWGALLRWFTWALQGAGYLITGLGLAAATGIIQKDRG